VRVISTITFMEDGVLVVYMDPEVDVRNEGKLILTHQLHVSGETSSDYGDEIEDLRDAARRLLSDALEDFDTTQGAENAGSRP
jgi:hypothetical protein